MTFHNDCIGHFLNLSRNDECLMPKVGSNPKCSITKDLSSSEGAEVEQRPEKEIRCDEIKQAKQEGSEKKATDEGNFEENGQLPADQVIQAYKEYWNKCDGTTQTIGDAISAAEKAKAKLEVSIKELSSTIEAASSDFYDQVLAAGPKLRLAFDCVAYTKAQFERYYGKKDGRRLWAAAATADKAVSLEVDTIDAPKGKQSEDLHQALYTKKEIVSKMVGAEVDALIADAASKIGCSAAAAKEHLAEDLMHLLLY